MVTPARAHPTHDFHGYITNIGYIGRTHSGFGDILSSTAHSTVIDVISEGEIEGSATASKAGITNKSSFAYGNAFLKDIYLDGTQIYQQNAPNNNGAPIDTFLNYKGIIFAVNHGQTNQTALPGLVQVETEIPVGVTVTNNQPVTRTITNTGVDAVRVTVGFPAFQEIHPENGIQGTLVDINVKLIQGNGTTTTEIADTVIGKSNDAYFRQYLVNFPANAVFPIQVQVERDKVDSTSSTLIDSFQFTSFTEIIYQTRNYPDIAHTKLRFDSSISQNLPSRMFRIRGIKVKIPHNATVNIADGSITYSGTFNGTFKATKEWCSDPSWILFDILSNDRYGASIPEATIDQYAFYTASVYNNERVDAGKNDGSTEPRFSFSANINNSSEAYDLINQIASSMNAMPYYANSSITIAQDRPSDPVYQFTLANITEEGFTYAGSGQKTRHTVFNVSYFDLETQSVDYETIEDTQANITKFGSIVKNVTAFGCTSRNQAARLGRWFLYNEQRITETCTFTAFAEAGVLVRPGQIIQTSDPLKNTNNHRRGGLISSASITGIVADDDANTNLDNSNNPELSVILPDGTLETRPISSINGKAITVNPAFSQIPQANSVFILENTSIPPLQWKVVSIVENGLFYTITALNHDPNKYAFIEDGSPLPTRTIDIIHTLSNSPVGLSAREEIIVINNKAVSKLSITWQSVLGVEQYRVVYRLNNDNPITVDITRNNYEILNNQVGRYEIRVFSFNAIGEISTLPTTLTFNAIGKTAVPEDVTNLSAEPISDEFFRLRFDPSISKDVQHGGSVAIRHTPSTNPANNSFQNSQSILTVPGSSIEATVPALSGTYSVVFVDDGGRRSTNAAKVIVTVPESQPNQIIISEREDTDVPPFQGNINGTFFSSALGGLLLDGTEKWDSIGVTVPGQTVDDLTKIDFFGDIGKFGTYDFANKLDLGAIFNINLKRKFLTAGLQFNNLITARTELIDTWDTFDGLIARDVDAKLLMAHTNLDPNLVVSATYEQSDGSSGDGVFITITKNNHGYSIGEFVEINFTADSNNKKPENGNYGITSVPNANTFVVVSQISQTVSSGTACTYGANFTQFSPFINTQTRARGFKFKVELSSSDQSQNIRVEELGYEGSLPRRIDTINSNINSLCSTNNQAKVVNFSSSYFTGTGIIGGNATTYLPTIGITLEGASAGDYFKITSITGSQFVIETRDVNNAFKDLNFRYIAIGYGNGT